MQITEHFDSREFACRHCGKDGISRELVDALEELRVRVGRPVVVTSGYRCPEHPVERAKARPGLHALGIAADVTVPGMAARDVYRAAVEIGRFSGFGLDEQRNFVHLDIRSTTPARWAYRNGHVVPWKAPEKEAA